MTTTAEPATDPTELTTDSDVAPPTSVGRALAPLAIDLLVPIAVYLAAKQFGADTIDAYLLSSVVPVVRTVVGFATARRVNAVALLVLTVTLAGIGLTFAIGSVRLGTAKSAALSGVIAIGFLVSAVRGRPVLSAGMRPFLTRGDERRDAAWTHLSATSRRFRRLERRFTAVYGVALLSECLARVVAAACAPVSMLGWLPTVLLAAGLAVAVIVGGGVAADPIARLLDAETQTDPADATDAARD